MSKIKRTEQGFRLENPFAPGFAVSVQEHYDGELLFQLEIPEPSIEGAPPTVRYLFLSMAASDRAEAAAIIRGEPKPGA